MDELLVEQRKGYDLALDRLIRISEPKDRKLRADASLRLEESTEVEYRNTMILRGIYDAGLGEFRQAILDEGNAGLEKFDWKFDSLGHYDRQGAFRSRENAVLGEFLEIIGNYSGRGGEPSKDRKVEIRYLKNMVERQIHSRGLPGDVMIPVALDRALHDEGLDASQDYGRIIDFSLDFVNGQGNELKREKPNAYLIVHDEHPISSSGHFPGGSLEVLRNWGVMGDGSLKHYLFHFPGDGGSSIQIVRGESTDLNSAVSGVLEGLASKYLNGEFKGPKFAITNSRHTGELIRTFSIEGYNIVRSF